MTSDHLRVIVAHRPPFVYCNNKTCEYPTGLLIDLFQRILNYNKITISPEYIPVSGKDDAGGMLIDNQWTGVTGKLKEGIADVALFPLTRTAARLSVIDCTYSYIDQGLSLLVQSSMQDPGPLSVLAPFSLTLWVTLLCTVIAISLLFWALDRYGSWIRARQLKALQESGHLANKPWVQGKKGRRNHVMTSFMAAAGAPERPPRISWGGQVLYVVYCFFCLIMLSSYTANLASYLAVQRADGGIEGLQDVIRKSGLIAMNPNGSTNSYFQSQDSQVMQLQNSIKYCDSSTCVEWVRQGIVQAFVSDRTVLESLAMQQPCDLAVAGDPFGPGNLVIGLQNNSRLLSQFNAALQAFNEDGTLTMLRRNWLDNRSQCGDARVKVGNSRLTISQMLGAFVFLAIGVLVAFTTGTVENLKWCILKAACCQEGFETGDLDSAEAGQWPVRSSLARAVRFSRLSTLLLSSLSKAGRSSRGGGRGSLKTSYPCEGSGVFGADSCRVASAAAPVAFGARGGQDGSTLGGRPDSDVVSSSFASDQGEGRCSNIKATDVRGGSASSLRISASHGAAGSSTPAAAAADSASAGRANCHITAIYSAATPSLVTANYDGGTSNEGLRGPQGPANQAAGQSPVGTYELVCYERAVSVQGVEKQALDDVTVHRGVRMWYHGPHDYVAPMPSSLGAATSPLGTQAVGANGCTISPQAISGCYSRDSSGDGSALLALPPPPLLSADWSPSASRWNQNS
ncbi:hypothetical protein VaNZ11_004445 [Volvox africanus]|uniref:Ionotropic glutamate receptor C-terminal domain-containing protein n=1 Tax=Volvox africanus TaxID=51714 RepID=A0ABQ5RWC6_9CHLO|nr:hypothetical protein VaNZ11_004445 [Volvox africanus]